MIGTAGGTGADTDDRAEAGPALSPAQERLWFLHQLEPDDASYNIPLVLRLTGALSEPALRAAFDGTAARHEALRTRFPHLDGRPAARVEPPAPVPVESIDLRGRPADAPRLLAERTNAAFDLAQGPLLRVSLLRTDEDEHLLCLVLHHIVADGWSLNLLRAELATRYAAHLDGRAVELPELLPYTEYARREREFADGSEAEAALAHWCERLAGAPVLDLRPTVADGVGATGGAFHTRRIAGAGAAVDALARQKRCTPFMVLLAAYQVLLHRWTRQEDFCVGVPAAGRNEPELEELIGYFSTTLVLRAELAGSPTFGELLRRVRRSALAGFTHDRVPFERLIDELGIERRLGVSPLFQTLLTVHTQDEQGSGERDFAGLRCADVDGGHAAGKFEVMLDLRRESDDLIAVFGYRTDLYDDAWATRFARHFETLLRGALADPDAPVSELPLLARSEVDELLALGTGAEVPAADTEALPAALGRAAAAYGDRTAVRDAAGELTYEGLWQAAGALAVRLREAGVRGGDVVGVRLPRGTRAVTAMLAAWRAGAAYLPLDPAYPAARLEFMVADTGVRVVVADPDGAEAFGGGPAHRPIALAPDGPGGTGVPDPRWEAGPDDPAYVIHTSGSTGTPKGVVVPHRALAARVGWMRENYGITADDEVLQFASLSFDTHAEEIYPALTAGARLVVAGPDSTLPDHLHLAAAGQGGGPTVLDLPTPYWHELVDDLDTIARPPGLRLLILGADQVQSRAVAAWRARFGDTVRVVNSYGPTETTVIAATAELGRADATHRPPIGSPIAGTVLTVCDALGRLMPYGAPGELLVGGVGVTYGYGGRPGATARAFVPDPYGPPGARRYRTGDLVRWRADGRLEFLGRIDDQVKVRGFRVEPGEVETALLALDGVGRAVVTVRDEALVGYVVPERDGGDRPEALRDSGDCPEDQGSGGDRPEALGGGGDPEAPGGGGQRLAAGALRAALAAVLPAHLVPNSLVVLDALPLTPNGKVDRRALPAPEQRPDLGPGYVAPRTDAEGLVAEVWTEVLGLDRVGALDDFFDLGGHSLLATRVVARIRAAAGLTVPLRALFAHRTVEAFAGAVEDLLLAEIEALTDEDAEQLLAAESGPERTAESGPERNGTTTA
ncbi:non-ribosomal peptide synthetase [Streptomyces sp. SID14515]|uniref:non-ribosomal peptide synthetase n=1 Tax=Streptomyces sp. SID14515 TaxID=2706074 RepID=UPI0013C910F7|nr:non-ribosomal peptide synthetase [Streptomyces sp. SID14515]NEB42428.1 amino acid adenylation domain-containing protein [Streptomyces sp. SID14515]